MHILMGVHGLPPESVGGAELFSLRLARALARAHEVTLFHPLLDPRLPPGSGSSRREGRLRIVGRALTPPRTFTETWRRPEAERWFLELIERYQPDVCHLQHLTGLSTELPRLARERGLPTVLTLHDYWLPCARGQLVDLDLAVCPGPRADRCATCLADQIALDRSVGQWAGRVFQRVRPPEQWLELGRRIYGQARWRSGPSRLELERAGERIADTRRALEAATLLTSPSRHLLATYRALYPGLGPMEFVDHGFEAREERREEEAGPSGAFWVENAGGSGQLRAESAGGSEQSRREGGGPYSPLQVGFLGAIIPTKGPDLLLRAVEGIGAERIRVSMAGPMPRFHRRPEYGEQVKARAVALGVEWRGVLSPQEVPAWLREQQVLVVPSIWLENAPLVLGEAFREGVPVIGSSIGGIPERVRDGVNGRLVPPGDVRALRGALLEALEHPERLAAWRAGAWRTALSTVEEQVGQWESIYGSLLVSGGVSNPAAPDAETGPVP